MRRSLRAALLAAAAAGCDEGKKPAVGPADKDGVLAAESPKAPEIGWRMDCHDAEVPDRPAAGAVAGLPFTVDGGEYNEGILKLRQGKDFFADFEFTLFLFLDDKTVLPAGRCWKVKPSKGFSNPHVHLSRKPEKDGIPKTEMVMGDYAMRLELGPTDGDFMEGRIWLSMPDDKKSFVAGTFRVPVNGFVMKEGKPDRKKDSFLLFEWLAREHLEKQHEGKAVRIADTRGGMFSANPDGETGRGSLSVHWETDGRSRAWLKFLFEKSGEWRVARVFGPSELPEAHPEKVPDAKTGDRDYLEYAAAVELERELAGRTVFSGFTNAMTREKKWGYVTYHYEIEGQQDGQKKTWVFRYGPDGWKMERELAEGEQLDMGDGTIKK